MMRRRHTPLVLVFGVLVGLLPAPARADGLKITGVALGIAGRYRPGGWVPVAVTAVNTGSVTAHGQVQIAGDAAGGAVFARPVDIRGKGAPQTFSLDARGLDPSRGDLTAGVVSGSARGDGPALAEVGSSSPTGQSVFSGAPVSDRDLLLVGFSADPTAFTPLGGQKWGLMHTAGAVTADTAVPTAASVQLAAAGAGDLPDRPAAYAGVDAVLLRADAPLDALTEAQADALKAWVGAGGRLIVCGGADPALFSDSFFAGLLPASVGPDALRPKPLPGVRVLAAASGRPTVVSGPYGVGQVTLLAFDPTRPPSSPALWRAIFAAGPSSLLPVVAAREEGADHWSYGGQSRLAEAVMHAPALDAPGADAVGVFLLAYVLILVPVNYLVLKRLDRKEWAWATIPALVAVFAAGTYAVGYAAKGGRVFVNRAAIVEASAGQRRAGLYAAVGLFSPRRASYDLTVADPSTLAAVPPPPEAGPYYRRRAQPADGYGPARIVEGAEDALIQDASVNMWAMRAFDTQTTVDLGGAITSSVSAASATPHITLTNHTPYLLQDCRLLVNGFWTPLGTLGPGGAASAPQPTPPAGGSYTRAGGWEGLSPAALGGPNAGVQERMRAALGDFARSLGGQYQYFGGGYSPPAAFTPRPGEAILTGWCDDPALAGPPVRVGGHPATEYAVTLVVVHIPLR